MLLRIYRFNVVLLHFNVSKICLCLTNLIHLFVSNKNSSILSLFSLLYMPNILLFFANIQLLVLWVNVTSFFSHFNNFIFSNCNDQGGCRYSFRSFLSWKLDSFFFSYCFLFLVKCHQKLDIFPWPLYGWSLVGVDMKGFDLLPFTS